METVGLAQAVDALRNELTEAREAGQGEGLLFEVGPVDVEFSAVVTSGADGKAGIAIGVLTLGGGGSVSHEQTHRVKVTLTPKDAVTGEAPKITDVVTELPPR